VTNGILCGSVVIGRESSAGISYPILHLRLHAGVHTGEVERVGRTNVRGVAVHTAARIAALVFSSEVFFSATVKDLVAGSGLTFEDRGVRMLKGLPEPRQVFAVSGES
jgi:class 3 adenylate cyclase